MEIHSVFTFFRDLTLKSTNFYSKISIIYKDFNSSKNILKTKPDISFFYLLMSTVLELGVCITV